MEYLQGGAVRTTDEIVAAFTEFGPRVPARTLLEVGR
jgi:hypothetical protein